MSALPSQRSGHTRAPFQWGMEQVAQSRRTTAPGLRLFKRSQPNPVLQAQPWVFPFFVAIAALLALCHVTPRLEAMAPGHAARLREKAGTVRARRRYIRGRSGERGSCPDQDAVCSSSAEVLPLRASRTSSYVIFWPSARPRRPARSTALIWTIPAE
jgi:hypothetical protein